MSVLPAIPLVLLLAVQATLAMPANADKPASGRDIMQEVYKRHEQFPYIYEEQVMVLIDAAGNRDTRKLRRYSRLDSAESGRYLLLFDDPPEVRGVGLLTTILPPEKILANIYLPAYGPRLIESVGQNQADTFLGTDFSVNDLLPEPLDRYRFVRQPDEQLGDLHYFVLDVYRSNAGDDEPPVKRHYVRQDNYYITRTDTFDRHGRVVKQLTHHDLKPLGGNMWRANMILMKDIRSNHQSLIKISRRVFSRDYVPEELFTLQWLIDNQHMPAQEDNPSSSQIDENNPARINISQMTENTQ